MSSQIFVLRDSSRSAFILQSKLSLAPIGPEGHYGVVVLAIAAIGEFISGADLGVGHLAHQLLRAFERQVNLVEFDGVENGFGNLSIFGAARWARIVLAQANQF